MDYTITDIADKNPKRSIFAFIHNDRNAVPPPTIYDVAYPEATMRRNIYVDYLWNHVLGDNCDIAQVSIRNGITIDGI